MRNRDRRPKEPHPEASLFGCPQDAWYDRPADQGYRKPLHCRRKGLGRAALPAPFACKASTRWLGPSDIASRPWQRLLQASFAGHESPGGAREEGRMYTPLGDFGPLLVHSKLFPSWRHRAGSVCQFLCQSCATLCRWLPLCSVSVDTCHPPHYPKTTAFRRKQGARP